MRPYQHTYSAASALSVLIAYVGDEHASARRLAEVIGVTRRTIVRWRSGQVGVRPRVVDDIERVTGVPASLMEVQR